MHLERVTVKSKENSKTELVALLARIRTGKKRTICPVRWHLCILGVIMPSARALVLYLPGHATDRLEEAPLTSPRPLVRQPGVSANPTQGALDQGLLNALNPPRTGQLYTSKWA